MLSALYKVFRPILFSCDAELAHRIALSFLAALPPGARPSDPPELRVRLWDREFINPVGLAAGMDKNAVAAPAWQRVGFGFVEMGTVTPRPQPGNRQPRLFRLKEHRALVNRLGFPGDGMEAIARRIERLKSRGVAISIGVNIGPNKNTLESDVARDYAAVMARISPVADFIVINISSPNTPGLRDWQAPERMRTILSAINGAISQKLRHTPILVKISPDLEPEPLGQICDAALELGLDGIVATNTTIAREAVGINFSEAGGLSGAPLTERSRAIIRQIYRRVGPKLPIIGVGGIMNAEDAWEHIRAGASLVELYTGLIYEGPGVVTAIKSGLLGLLRREGFRSISEAVGSKA